MKPRPEILVEILVRRNVAAALLQAKLHLNLAAFADGGDVNVLVQDLDIAIGFDHAAGDNTRLIGAQIDHLRRIAGELEGICFRLRMMSVASSTTPGID